MFTILFQLNLFLFRYFNTFAILIICAGMTAVIVKAQPDTFATPSLRGVEAVSELKQTGSYETLLKAVREVQTDSAIAPNAVGQAAKLVAGDGAAGDEFGFSVAVSGETAVVGAYLDDAPNTDQGSAYVFIRNGAAWTLQAKLTAANGAPNDRFGYSVGIDGGTIIVGAYLDDAGATDQGSAYIFTRSGESWSQHAQLFAENGAAGDFYGFSVAINNDTAAIGAIFDDVDGSVDQGTTDVFVRSGAAWMRQAQLKAMDGAANDQFGRSVAISGETLIVGSTLDDVGGNDNQGSAYVFVRSATAWTQQAQLVALNPAPSDLFGYSVSISGETAVIGAFNSDVGANFDQGAAYVFVRSGTSWSQQARLTAADGASIDNFGWSVAISRETIVVGAYVDNVGSNSDQGSAYLFTRSGATWTQRQQLTAADGEANDFFGNSVAISGNNIFVGAHRDDFGANADQGAAYNFRVLSPNWTLETKTTSSDGLFDDQFGISVAISGDTAVVGAYLDDVNGKNSQGSAYIFVRNGTGWTQQTQLLASDGAANDRFGVSVAIDGNTVIVGSYQSDGAAMDQGAAYVFVRNTANNNWTPQAKLAAGDGESFDFFGYSVAIDGDTAVIGAYADDSPAVEQGSAYVFTRSGANWTQQTRLTAGDGATNDQFGISVSISNNTVVVGAFLDDFLINTDQGSAYVFVRSGVTWSQQAQLQAPLGVNGGAANDRFGISVAVSGETAVVGVFFDDVGANGNQGSAYIFARSGTTWAQQTQLVATDSAADDRFGASVAIDGDIAVVGAIFDDVGENFDQGSAYVFERNGTTWTQITRLIDVAGATNDYFGTHAAISGDKIIVGLPSADPVTFAGTSGGEMRRDNSPDALDQGSVLFFVNTPAATAANISIGGRVLTNDGSGLAKAVVVLTDSKGVSRTARSTAFGYYYFGDVTTGESYVVSVRSKRYRFAPQFVSAGGNVINLNLTAEPQDDGAR